MTLEDLGWDETFARQLAGLVSKPGLQVGRVAVEFNHIYRLYTAVGEQVAVISGRLKHQATSRSGLPAVGDWVLFHRDPTLDRGTIQQVLPRRSKFSRKVAGNTTDEQIVAANVDDAFLVMGLDDDFNLRRLERYVVLARQSGAAPVIVLTKPDVCADVAAHAGEVTALHPDLPVHVVSPRRGEGLEHISRYLKVGRTGALLGSSGVGKSTIINRLAGSERQKTAEVRASDSRGRHTTSHRELVLLPDGGLLIDTPGMRELQLWDVSEGVRDTFDDIEALATACHFADCSHRAEPRCAVKSAVEKGQLPSDRLESYLKLQEELTQLARQQDEREQSGKVGRRRDR